MIVAVRTSVGDISFKDQGRDDVRHRASAQDVIAAAGGRRIAVFNAMESLPPFAGVDGRFFELAAPWRFANMQPESVFARSQRDLDEAGASVLHPTNSTEAALHLAVCEHLWARVQELSRLTFPSSELDIIEHTLREGVRGVALDGRLAKELRARWLRMRDVARSNLVAAHPRFDPAHAQRPDAIKQYVEKTWRVTMHSVRRGGADDLGIAVDSPQAHAFLTLVRSYSGLRRLSDDAGKFVAQGERIYQPLQYAAAVTGRFSAPATVAGINLQAMPSRPQPWAHDAPELRGVVVPDEGKVWVSADLRQIEARIVAWLAGEARLLEQFRQGVDVYSAFAEQVFPDARGADDATRARYRKLGKEATLALNFGQGLDGFKARVRSVDPGVPEVDITRAFEAHLQAFPRIHELRRALLNRAVATLDTKNPGAVGALTWRHVEFKAGPALALVLPTGRAVLYHGIKTKNGSLEYVPNFALPAPGKPARGGETSLLWRTTVIENAAQAIARDMLVAYVLELERRVDVPLRVRFTVHDELVVETDVEHGDEARRVVVEVMSRPPPSLPGLGGLPVACEVSEPTRRFS